MSKRCPWCKVDVYLTELKHWYKCPECQTEFPERAFPKEITVFDHITESPEALAGKFIFSRGERYWRRRRCETVCYEVWWSALTGEEYRSKDEAFDATLKRLKEVYSESR